LLSGTAPKTDIAHDDPVARYRLVELYAVRCSCGVDLYTGLASPEVTRSACRGYCTQPGYEGSRIVRNVLIDLVSDLAAAEGIVDPVTGAVSWPVRRHRSPHNPYRGIMHRLSARSVALAREAAGRATGAARAPVSVVISGEAPIYVAWGVIRALSQAGFNVAVEDPFAGRLSLQAAEVVPTQ
jgi:hypothetical protein